MGEPPTEAAGRQSIRKKSTPAALSAKWRMNGASAGYGTQHFDSCLDDFRISELLRQNARRFPVSPKASRINSPARDIIRLGMLIRRPPDIRASEITPKHLYLNRRRFLAGLPLAGAAFMARGATPDTRLNGVTKSSFSTSEKLTPLQDVTHYNN